MKRLLEIAAMLFPLWTLLGGAVALIWPATFLWVTRPWIIGGLAVIMLGMGLTLSFADFARALRMPGAVAVGVLLQFTIMPLTGWAVAMLMDLPTAFAVGLILVAACPGGTASNVVSYIARADVPLSVLMTTASTFAAVALTPLYTEWLAGKLVPVDGWGLFRTTLQVVVAPVVTGLLLHQFAPKIVRKVTPAAPLVAVAAIVIIVAGIIAASRDAILAHATELVVAVFLLHAAGFGLGYGLAWVFGYHEQARRTLSIEVGMQNSGLAVALARTHFAAAPLTAVPGAVSSVMHSVLGSVLAGIWRAYRPASESATPPPEPESNPTPLPADRR